MQEIFMLDKPSITSSIIDEETRKIIQDNNLMYIEDNSTPEELETILRYLKDIPQQWWKISVLLSLIWSKNISLLIDNITREMLSAIIIHSNLNGIQKLFRNYNEYEIIHTINKYNYNNVHSEWKKHVLIVAINKWKLPWFIDEYIINICKRSKIFVSEALENKSKN